MSTDGLTSTRPSYPGPYDSGATAALLPSEASLGAVPDAPRSQLYREIKAQLGLNSAVPSLDAASGGGANGTVGTPVAAGRPSGTHMGQLHQHPQTELGRLFYAHRSGCAHDCVQDHVIMTVSNWLLADGCACPRLACSQPGCMCKLASSNMSQPMRQTCPCRESARSAMAARSPVLSRRASRPASKQTSKQTSRHQSGTFPDDDNDCRGDVSTAAIAHVPERSSAPHLAPAPAAQDSSAKADARSGSLVGHLTGLVIKARWANS